MINVVAKRLNKIKRKQEQKKLIDKIKELVKKEKAYLDLCKEYDKDIDFVDDVNISFDDLDVSAKTVNGDVFINEKLLDKGDLVDVVRYAIHELVHTQQQASGAVRETYDKEDYLDDPNEQEAFQFQIQYMEDHVSQEEIQEYLEHLLDHHGIEGKERMEKIKKLTKNI